MVERATGEQIYAEQVRQLYRLSRPAYVAALINAGIITFALWDLVSNVLLAAWFAVMLGVTGARYFLYRAYSRAAPREEQAPVWGDRFVYGTGAMGLLWGFVGSALYPAASIPHQFLVIFLIGGMALSGMVVLAPVRQAFLAYALPSLALVTATVFTQGTNLHLFMGVLLVVMLGVLLATSPIISEMMRESLRAQFENAGLVEQLSASNRELSERAMRESLRAKFENAELVKQLSEANRELSERAMRESLHAKFENAGLVEQLSAANRELSERIVAQQHAEEVLGQTSKRLEALIEASPLAIVVRDTEGRVEKWNAAAQRMLGWTEQEVLGRLAPLLPPGREQEAPCNRERILRGEAFSDVETVRMRKDGTAVSVRMSAAPVYDSAGKPVSYITMLTDVTERKHTEQRQNLENAVTLLLAEAQSMEEVMPRVIQTLCEGLGYVYGARWILDNKERVLRCAESWCVPDTAVEDFRRVSAGRVEVPGMPGGLNRRVWATSAPYWIADLGQELTLRRALEAGLQNAFALPILAGGEFYGVMEFFGRGTRPRDEHVLEIANTVGMQIGQFVGRKQAETNLQFFASYDPLTGLFNRGIFNQRLQQALAQAQRFARSLAVLFIDLDGFKFVNDTLGHSAGDIVLTEVAARLRATLREGDIIARMGGDEFVVLIEEFEGAPQVAEVAKKILETVARPFALHNHDYTLTASLGISTFPEDGSDAQTLLKNADIAMYRAKDDGKNNFRFFAPEMNVHLIERLSLENDLRRAVERGEFVLLYQPKVGVRDGQVSGVEALVRWQHPAQGMIGPSEFVPVAEDAGLMAVIGEWVLHTACRQVQAWREQGLPLVRMAVNLSLRQLAHENLIQVVRGALHQYAVDPDRLELEFTEAMVMRNPDRAEKLLVQLEELGVRLVIDDFGTGFSSLNYLKRLPVDGVKIDRSLIHHLLHDAGAVALTRAVIAMAHSLDISVVAEGVETRAQWEFLQQLGCEEMQGNYFSTPVPAGMVSSILREPGTAGKRASILALRPLRDGERGQEFES